MAYISRAKRGGQKSHQLKKGIHSPEYRATHGVPTRGRRKAGRREYEHVVGRPAKIIDQDLLRAADKMMIPVKPDIQIRDRRGKKKLEYEEYDSLVRIPICYSLPLVLDLELDAEVKKVVKRELIDELVRTGANPRGAHHTAKAMLDAIWGRRQGSILDSTTDQFLLEQAMKPITPRKTFTGTAKKLYEANYRRRTTTSSVDKNTGELEYEYSKVDEKRESAIKTLGLDQNWYMNRVCERLANRGVISHAAFIVMRLASWIRSDLMLEGMNPYEITRSGLFKAVTMVMAEYVEQRTKMRMMAENLGDSELYRTFKVYPMYAVGDPPKHQGAAKTSTMLHFGVLIEMKMYGMWLDTGRGPTKDRSKKYEDYRESPFFQAVYEWALDHVQVGYVKGSRAAVTAHIQTRGENPREKTVRARDLHRGKAEFANTERRTPLRRVESFELKGLEQFQMSNYQMAGLGSQRPETKEFAKAYRLQKQMTELLARRGTGESKKFTLMDVRYLAADIRSEQMALSASRGGFEAMVYLIYHFLNTHGFEGTYFLSESLKHMIDREVIDYYFGLYAEDILKKHIDEDPDSPLHGKPTKEIFTNNKGVRSRTRVEIGLGEQVSYRTFSSSWDAEHEE